MDVFSWPFNESISHSSPKCSSVIQISNRFKELPVYWISFSIAIESTSKRIISFRYHASFLPFTTFLKHGFQSLILRTVNFRSLLNFVHLPKIYGTLRFMDSIQLCFWTYEFSWRKLFSLPYVTETNMTAFRHQICKMKDRPFFGYSLAIFFAMFSTKV